MGEGLQGTSFLSFLSFFLSLAPSLPPILPSSAVFLSSFNIIF